MPARVAAGEQDREERDHGDDEEGDPQEHEHDVVGDGQQPLDQPQPAAEAGVERALQPQGIGRPGLPLLGRIRGTGDVEMPAARRALVDRLFASRFPGLPRLFGGFVEDAERFDAEFFGFSDEEVLRWTRSSALFLVAAWQAVEDAGYYPRSLSGRNIGVYAGAIANEYAHLLSAAGSTSQFIGTGNALSGIANRVSYVLESERSQPDHRCRLLAARCTRSIARSRTSARAYARRRWWVA